MFENLIISVLVYGFMMYYMTNSLMKYANNYVDEKGYTSIWKNRLLLWPIIVFSLFAALRWNVGVDCNSYMRIFYHCFSKNINSEPLWKFVEQTLYANGFSHYYFFFIAAFAQLGVVVYALRKKVYILAFFPLALFLTRDYWMWMNGMRQILACSIIMLSILYMEQKRYWLTLLMIFIAFNIHRSAYSMCLVLPALYLTKGKNLNKWLQLGCLFFCCAMQGVGISDVISAFLQNVAGDAGYNNAQMSIINVNMNINFGLRSYMTLGSITLAIWVSDEVKQYYDDRFYNYLYNMFFVGSCLLMLFYTNLGMLRAILYFTYFTTPVVSATLYYFYSSYKTIGSKSMIPIALLVFLVFNFGYELIAPVALSERMDCTLYKFCFGHHIPTK